MTTAMLQVEAACGDIDDALWSLRSVRLERRPDGLFLTCDVDVATAVRLVARAGLRAYPRDPGPVGAPLVPSAVADLAPCDLPGIVDRVSIRAIDPGEASLRLRGARWRRPRYSARVRDLLHDADRMYGWSRRIWASPSALRSSGLRGTRPIVFDRDSVDRGAERCGFVGDGHLARWVAA